jgi:wyosine [tRNA(Phe)-imidazoG37] synthetase (radical SAM superfamily)
MPIVFGPVPSRRLGRSLGINNIPPKSCSYSCRYCQVGTTHGTSVEPQVFYSPAKILEAVETQLEKLSTVDEQIDYLTFVPDGEPGLDSQLGLMIEHLRPLGVPIAVITNGSLLWREDVRLAVARADWVSVKVDSVLDTAWRRLNRPHESLQLPVVLDGIRQFAGEFSGEMVTETMLVEGINDSMESVAATAEFLPTLGCAKAYLAVPTRPPADPTVRAPSEAVVNRAYQQFAGYLQQVELLIGYEGDAFAYSGDIEHDLLGITAVHPMRKSAVQSLLAKAGADWQVVDRLLASSKLVTTEHHGETFYMRRFSRQQTTE